MKESLINELFLHDLVNECSFDINGNHVVQKIVTEMGQEVYSETMSYFLQQIEEKIISYSLDVKGCRIVQRMFESCHPTFLCNSASILIENFYDLIRNDNGIYVLSSMLDNCWNDIKN